MFYQGTHHVEAHYYFASLSYIYYDLKKTSNRSSAPCEFPLLYIYIYTYTYVNLSVFVQSTRGADTLKMNYACLLCRHCCECTSEKNIPSLARETARYMKCSPQEASEWPCLESCPHNGAKGSEKTGLSLEWLEHG